MPLHCSSCISSVSQALHTLPGIHSVSAELSTQLIHISGTAAPSSIVAAIQSTGRDAILRGSGSGSAESNSAAVCILETHAPSIPAGANTIRGLARMVQVQVQSDQHPRLPRTLVDLTLRGVEPGTYYATVRATGDVSRGAASTGSVWDGLTSAWRPDDVRPRRGELGQLEVGRDGKGSVLLLREVGVSEIIGRAMVVSKEKPEAGTRTSGEDDGATTVVGVIARSAGVWDNDKTVCSCSGKSVWEERTEQVGKGMM